MTIFRYLFFEYLKVLLLCTLSFVAILLTTRLEEIARFAAAGGQGMLMLKFAALQIPYILPIVLPISCLISAIVLAQRMSAGQEITTLRASGLSLWSIFAPVLIAAGLISMLNYYLVSEVATESVLRSRMLQREVTLINPLTLLYNQHLIRHRDLLLFSDGKSLGKNSAGDITCAIWNADAKRICLVKMDQLNYKEPTIEGKHMTMFSSFKPNERDRFDNLYLENVNSASMDMAGLSLFLKRTTARLCDDYLAMGMLLCRINEFKQEADSSSTLPHIQKEAGEKVVRGYSEILRRTSVGMAVFSLTLLGLSFGTYTGRNPGAKTLYAVIALASLLIIGIFAAKSFMGNPLISGAFYFIPQILILALCTWQIRRINNGAEG